jgi:putative transposase
VGKVVGVRSCNHTFIMIACSMARPLRIEYPGALYHVTSRGNAGNGIYIDDKDRAYFLELLGSIKERFHWLCHAYCLMDNHYHLIIETPEGKLSQGMRQLNGVYTQKYNKKYKKTGHIFQGRYKAIIVDKDNYLLELCRYVALNPVRAHMVEKPEDFIWSSYRATSGTTNSPAFLTTDWILGQFSTTKNKAQKLYTLFVEEGIAKESPWKELKGQIFLGDKTFIEKAASHDSIRPKEVPRLQRYADRPLLQELFTGSIVNTAHRNETIYVACTTYGYTFKEVADHLHIHYATVGRAIKDMERKLYDCKTSYYYA